MWVINMNGRNCGDCGGYKKEGDVDNSQTNFIFIFGALTFIFITLSIILLSI